MTPREEGHCWLAESRDEVILNPGPSSQFGVTLSVTISKEQMNALAFRVPIYLVGPQCILCRKQCAQIGCCTACGSILQYTSWHASWTTLTHNPLHSGSCVTLTGQLWEHKQMMAHRQTAVGQCSECSVILNLYVSTVCILHSTVCTLWGWPQYA